MQLRYKILWFEDEKDFANSYFDELKEFIEDMGFLYEDPSVKSDDTDFDKIKFTDYDIILMDYALSTSVTGGTIIKKIRNLEIYTNIIFYSTRDIQVLRTAIKDQELDGIFCLNRSSAGFIERIQDIIKASVRKAMDLNNIRGLVMAEVSDFDEQMKEIIDLYIAKLSDSEKSNFMTKRLKKVVDSLEGKKKKISGTPIDKIHYERDFDAMQKLLTIQSILKNFKVDELKKCLDTYDVEIVQKRNKLGHVKEETDSSGNKYLTGGDYIFNEDAYKQLFSDIKKHTKNFKRIKDALKN
jgi:CheY-like chemotaxis protein